MAQAKQARLNSSAIKVFQVLDVLTRSFFHGFSPTDLSRETGFSMSAINGYVNTLIEAGYAERIQETGRIRPSQRLARSAVQIMNSLDAAEHKLRDIKSRVYSSTPEHEIDNLKDRLVK